MEKHISGWMERSLERKGALRKMACYVIYAPKVNAQNSEEGGMDVESGE